jgi:hypothetical protein
MEGRSLLRAFEIKKYIKRYVKCSVSGYLSPFWNLDGIRLPGRFERKGKSIWVHFLDPEDIKILSMWDIWDFGKGTGLS